MLTLFKAMVGMQLPSTSISICKALAILSLPSICMRSSAHRISPVHAALVYTSAAKDSSSIVQCAQ